MIKLIQVTDPHIGATADYRLAGVDTRRTFHEVMEQVRTEEPEVLLMTGDNAADYSEGAYEYFFSVMQTFEQPHYWIPGNHDKVSAAESARGGKPFQRTLDLGDWLIVMLDSVIPRSPNGNLGPEELQALEEILEQSAHENIIICLHHHPVNINCAWLDTQKVADADYFFATVDRFPGVKAIFWGHIHQEFNSRHGDVLLHSCPSTCIQFLPDSNEFALDSRSPGYRVIELNDDGSINTYVRRVEIPDMGIDIGCLGYE
jgi:Icc protein